MNVVALTTCCLAICRAWLQYNEGSRVPWGGGIMGIKSQHKAKQKERILAKELAQRLGA
jgi:hypothetical protein